jgi:formate hydrogenlyase transcriptional activator
MEALQSRSWPGNVRELRNVIEHAAIVTSGDTLRVPMLLDVEPGVQRAETLATSEQDHILRALEKTGWRIKGPRGAATLLGVKPSTLYSRMQKLGIPNRRQKKTAGN